MSTRIYKAGDNVCETRSGECYRLTYAYEDGSYAAGAVRFWHSEIEPAPEAAGGPEDSEFVLVCVTPGVEIPMFNSPEWNRESVRAVLKQRETEVDG